jgi:hypothetical protein
MCLPLQLVNLCNIAHIPLLSSAADTVLKLGVPSRHHLPDGLLDRAALPLAQNDHIICQEMGCCRPEGVRGLPSATGTVWPTCSVPAAAAVVWYATSCGCGRRSIPTLWCVKPSDNPTKNFGGLSDHYFLFCGCLNHQNVQNGKGYVIGNREVA